MTEPAPKRLCWRCRRVPADDGEAFCAGCKVIVERQIARNNGSPNPMNHFCSCCGLWKDSPGPDPCDVCKPKHTTNEGPQHMTDHIDEKQREAFEELGASAARLYLVIAGAFGLTTNLRDPSDVDALQAWMLGFAKSWGTSDEIRDAVLARFKKGLLEDLQQERTNS